MQMSRCYPWWPNIVLSLVAKHLGAIGLPSPLLKEVDQIGRNACTRLRLTLVEPTLRQSVEASEREGALSFEDKLCLIVARGASTPIASPRSGLQRNRCLLLER